MKVLYYLGGVAEHPRQKRQSARCALLITLYVYPVRYGVWVRKS